MGADCATSDGGGTSSDIPAGAGTAADRDAAGANQVEGGGSDADVPAGATHKGPDKGRRTHHAKMNYLRDRPDKMAALVAGVKG